MAKTTKELPKKRRPAKPFTGKEGNSFSKDNQPTPEQKKAGWEQWRKERHLTQAIVKKMLGVNGKPTRTMTDFINKLVQNANRGNPKAIETIYKCIEDDVIKVAQTDPNGNPVTTITQVQIVPPPKIDGD